MPDNRNMFVDKPQRIHLLYRGRVQAVGFRFTFQDIALKAGVKGYVRNLPDGTVEAVCEGPKDKLDHVVRTVSSVMGGYISSSCETDEIFSGEFSSFSINFKQGE